MELAIFAFKSVRHLINKHVLVHFKGATGIDEAVVCEYLIYSTHHQIRPERTQMEREVKTPSGDLLNADGLQTERETSALFAQTSAENMPVKTDRVLKKAKRSLKVNAKQDDGSTTSKNGPLMSRSPTSPSGAHFKGGSVPFSKNSRKSRNVLTHGRGQPKKGTNFLIVGCYSVSDGIGLDMSSQSQF